MPTNCASLVSVTSARSSPLPCGTKLKRKVGFSLTEIRELLALRVSAQTTCEEVERRARAKLDAVNVRIAELDGVRVFDRGGRPIGHIHLPERCANLCFGGERRNRLFMAAGHSLYALYVNVQGTA